MNETTEVMIWHKPFEQWSLNCCGEFVSWVAEYIKENPDLKLKEAIDLFRMVMDTGYGEEPQSTERYATGWADARGIFGSGI